MALASVAPTRFLSASPSIAPRIDSTTATAWWWQVNSESTVLLGIAAALSTLVQQRRRLHRKRSVPTRLDCDAGAAPAAAPAEENPIAETKVTPVPPRAAGALHQALPRRKRKDRTSALIVVAYILCDVSIYLAGERASKGFTKQTLVFVSALTSVIIGTSVSALQHGWKGVEDCWRVRNVVRILPASACLCIAMLSLLLAFPYFDSGFIKIIGQTKLPLTAILSAVVLGKTYSRVQWQIILLICVACTSLTSLKIDSHVAIGAVPFFGLLCVLAWVGFNVFGSLLAERAFKKQTDQPFATVLTNLRIGELVVVTVMLFLLPNFRMRDFFKGWNSSTLVVLAALLGETWFAGLMVKQLSSVTKIITKSCTLVLLYGFGLASGRQPFVLVQALGATMIIQSSVLFTAVTVQGGKGGTAAQAPKDAA